MASGGAIIEKSIKPSIYEVSSNDTKASDMNLYFDGVEENSGRNQEN